MLRAEGSRAPDVGILALAIDDALDPIHPKILKRLCIGPLYTPLLLAQHPAGDADAPSLFATLLQQHGRRPDDFVPAALRRDRLLKAQQVTRSLLSPRGKVREIFAITETDPECYARRASVVHHNVVLPHDLLQHRGTGHPGRRARASPLSQDHVRRGGGDGDPWLARRRFRSSSASSASSRSARTGCSSRSNGRPRRRRRRRPRFLRARPNGATSSIVQPTEQRISLLQIAHQLSRDPVLLSDDAHRVLSVVRRGIQIGAHLSKLYGKASNLETLIEQNQRGGLADPQKAEFRAKYQSAAAIALFSLAYTVAWELASYKAEETANVGVELGPLPELTLRSPVEAIDCTLYYYGAFLERSGAVTNDLELVRATSLYFRAVLDEIKLREGALEFVEPFVTRTYKLEGSELTIDGFATDLGGTEAGIEFNRVELHQIVGNRDAKHWARRLAERLVCYDPASKRNPMYDLAGSLVNLGHGEARYRQVDDHRRRGDAARRPLQDARHPVPLLADAGHDRVDVPGRLGGADDEVDVGDARPDARHLRPDRRR